MLFADSLLDVSTGRGRRRWSSAMACAIEAVLIAGAVVLPLWSTQALPHFAARYAMAGPPPGAPPKPPHSGPAHPTAHPAPATDSTILRTPANIPPSIDMKPDPPAPEPVGPPGLWVPGGTGDPHSGGSGLLPGLLPPPPPAPAPPPPRRGERTIVSSGVQQGYLLRQVQPVYPSIARAVRVEGTVVLAAIISRDGVVENLHVLSGPPMLLNAAIDAVRQWRYRPYLLNGQPVEVETQITVRFYFGKE